MLLIKESKKQLIWRERRQTQDEAEGSVLFITLLDNHILSTINLQCAM